MSWNLSLSSVEWKVDLFPTKRPPGVISSYDHPYSRGYLVIMGTAIIVPMTTILVLLRTYTKHFINKNGLGKEDCRSCRKRKSKDCFKVADLRLPPDSCLFAFAGFVSYNALCLWVLRFGDGIHQWNVPISHAMRFAQASLVFPLVDDVRSC